MRAILIIAIALVAQSALAQFGSVPGSRPHRGRDITLSTARPTVGDCLKVGTNVRQATDTGTPCGPAGSTTQVQYNLSGAFAGDSDFTFTGGGSKILRVLNAGSSNSSGIIVGSLAIGDSNAFNATNNSSAIFVNSAISSSINNYALLQDSSGNTILNASSGRTVRFRINNSDPASGAINVNGNDMNVGGGSGGHAMIVFGAPGATWAQLQLASGSLPTAEQGMIGVVGDKISFAIQTGPAFKEFALRDAAGTSGRVPFQTTSGRLTDDANLLYSTNLLTLTGAFKIIEDANGSFARNTNATALTTLATGATTTATASNLAAANSQIKAILLRVTTTITTAVSFTVGVTGGNVFCQIGTATTSNTSMTSGSTYVMVPCAHADSYVAAATTLTFTTNANPAAGAIRSTVVYDDFQAPTS